MPVVTLPPYTIQPATIALGESVDWGLADAPELWEQTRGEGMKVAILDNGCDVDHPDLKGQIDGIKDFTGRGFVRGDHGTPVASIILAAENDIGLKGGAPKARGYIGQVMYGPAGSLRAMVDGFYWAIDDVQADVINFSGGFAGLDPAVSKVIEYGMSKGVLFAVAAGNDGRDNSVNSPARQTGGIAAYNRQGKLSQFSSRGPQILCACPGEGIMAATPGGGYGLHNGTSFAAPIFAVFATLARAKHKLVGGQTPLRSQAELREHVADACEDAGSPGFDNGFGYGKLLPKALVGAKPAPPDPMQETWVPKWRLSTNWALCSRA